MKTETKIFEIRDRATFIPTMAIRVVIENDASDEDYLACRAGWGVGNPGIYLTHMSTCQCSYDPFGWPGGVRTMSVAHQFIETNWDKLKSGAVIDVEFILKEVEQPKQSERSEGW